METAYSAEESAEEKRPVWGGEGGKAQALAGLGFILMQCKVTPGCEQEESRTQFPL